MDLLFGNGGELGRVMAGWDWASTPIGPPETWPPSLRSVVQILLTSRFSMWMGWGRELTFFYNDTYQRDTLRAKHPWALGRPASEVWAEIWPDIGPRIDSVLQSGAATWDEGLLLFLERSGYPEETYHTFSYSPLSDENGEIAGILCVVTEDTDRVLSERRMATLRDLASAVAATRTESDVIGAVQAQLSRNREDLPFTLSYLFADDGTAHLACTTGIHEGAPAAPGVIELGDRDDTWPAAQIRDGHTVVVDDFTGRFEQLPGSAWTQPPTQAAVVPLATAQGHGPAAGFIVVGLNPYRPFDDRYRGFIELLANQITSGLVSAGSYEAERRRAEALAELDRAKTDFFSNVSHEFRTPLTLIMGPVQELRSSPQWDETRVRAELEVVHRNGLRLGKLVNTLLEFSRLQAGRVQARFEPVDLAAFTAELASVFRSAIERAGLDYVVDCPSLPEPVFVDRDMWENVVLNLLSNALKFTFDGTITVTVRHDNGLAMLTVADTGTGVPAESLPRLFERFHRVERARSRSGEGSGIGLAMVRELLALHGGTITADSSPGVGTVFTVTVPLGRAHLPADQVMTPTAAPARVAVSPAAEPFVAEALHWLPGPEETSGQRSGVPAAGDPGPLGGSGRVLVADDNADMREYLHRLLGARYRVEVVGDGRAALAAALADPPDLIVTDVMMPGLDGMELLAALRADTRTTRVPVLLLSARAGQDAAVEGLAAGADDYLVKPFAAQELLARVSAHLQLGRVRREAEQRFTTMADLVPALIWVADPSGARAFLNAGWYRFTGRDPAAELGEGWRDGLHPEDRQRYLEMLAASTAARKPWEIEYRLRRADGSYHWLLEHAVPIGAGTGFVGSCTDINARYRETERQTLLAQVSAALDGTGLDSTGLDGEAGIEQRCSRLARLMVETRLADLCTVRRVDSEGQLVPGGAAATDPEAEATLAGIGETPFGRQVVATRRTVLVNDVAADSPGEAALLDPELAQRIAVRSALGVSLTARGRVLGVLELGRRADAPPYTNDDQVLVEEIAARAGLALDNAVLLTEERAIAARLAVLQRATAELSAAATPGQVASAALAHVGELLNPRRIAVFELDVAAQALTALSLADTDADARPQWATVGLHTPVPVAAAVREERAVWLEDREELRDDPAMAETMTGLGLGAVYALPLVAAGRPVGALGMGFTQPRRLDPGERAVLLALAEQCAQALDRARLYRAEHRIAETLQRSLLPQRLPQLQRLALAARYLPGAEGVQAGGDWYDFIELDSHRVAIAVGDVVGQGPAAAAVMGQLRTVLTGALRQGRNPAAALELLDEFAAWIPGARASTAACLILDWATGHVRWARAGHPPPLLIGDREPRYLDGEGHGPVLGMPGRPPFTEGFTVIDPGCTLVLYTDGLVERRGEVVDDGLARLAAAAARHAAATPDALLGHLLREVIEQGKYCDDVAVIAARLLPAALSQRLPARPAELAAVRRAVRAWAAAAGLSDELTEDLQLALGEAAANAAEHAYRGQQPGEFGYHVARATEGTLEVGVEDFGTWRTEPAGNHHRGRGLGLIRALADELVVDTTAHGTAVRFRLTARDQQPSPRPLCRDPATTGSAPGEAAELVVHHESGGLRLELRGELDLATVDTLRADLLGHLGKAAGGATVAVDLRATTYLASAGIALLVEATEHAHANHVTLQLLATPASLPARVLNLTGLSRDLPLTDR